MRQIAFNRQALSNAKNELDSARDELKSALGDIHHPADDFPWRNLLVDGVRGLIEDSEEIAKRCRYIANALDDSARDITGTDDIIHESAVLSTQVKAVTAQ